ncbi:MULTISPECIES: choloylglycine hydrolase family protein [unclassified Clostridium]|uniref:linear amide C-N hydrolase n=1 Tax=unclassified Clostridium TaxID=2614128 RepID=UPI0013FB1DE2|nr:MULTISPECIES: choloylglycine hydrolase family protein [unclassified Clostridium]NFR87583.1 choloylglycine hydrolase family protein [Clostridium botulinum]NFR90704.1 choloylglycine hydrolase family protein [Clostridium botulinum]NFU00522.1 choloylglycine hydrolase family protein [Clostridium botulinum]
MCTAITLQSEQLENFFGRTMDFSYGIDPELFIIPKNYEWTNFLSNKTICNKYSFMGIGQKKDGMLAFFDGVNEKGFAAATLYFAGYAKYDDEENSMKKESISSLDFLHYILGKCESVKDLKEVLLNISIKGLPDPVTKTVAPLHWIATDKSGECVVIEQTEDGLNIFKNEIGVMSNSPNFKWHMTNLTNYINVSQTQIDNTKWGNIQLKPFGQASGTIQLPGGYTSPERFVKTAYQKTHINMPKNSLDAINACFHIMESVTIPKGIVVTNRDTDDYTKYTAFVNTNTCEYFFKTYDNTQIIKASLFNNYRDSEEPISLGKLERKVKFEEI